MTRFLSYLNQLKYEIGNLKLPPYIIAAIGLLEPLRIASERLRYRKIERFLEFAGDCRGDPGGTSGTNGFIAELPEPHRLMTPP